MKTFLYCLAVIGGNLGLGTLLLKLWPRTQELADLYAPEADWPALAVAGMLALALWSIY